MDVSCRVCFYTGGGTSQQEGAWGPFEDPGRPAGGVRKRDGCNQSREKKLFPRQVHGPRVQAGGPLWVLARHPKVGRVPGGRGSDAGAARRRTQKAKENVWVIGRMARGQGALWAIRRQGYAAGPLQGTWAQILTLPLRSALP